MKRTYRYLDGVVAFLGVAIVFAISMAIVWSDWIPLVVAAVCAAYLVFYWISIFRLNRRVNRLFNKIDIW